MVREVGFFTLIAIVIAVVLRVQGAPLSDALVGGIVGFAAGLLVWRLTGLEIA